MAAVDFSVKIVFQVPDSNPRSRVVDYANNVLFSKFESTLSGAFSASDLTGRSLSRSLQVFLHPPSTWMCYPKVALEGDSDLSQDEINTRLDSVILRIKDAIVADAVAEGMPRMTIWYTHPRNATQKTREDT